MGELGLLTGYKQAGGHNDWDFKTAMKAHTLKVLVEKRIYKTETPLSVQFYVQAKIKHIVAIFLASKIQRNEAMK